MHAVVSWRLPPPPLPRLTLKASLHGMAVFSSLPDSNTLPILPPPHPRTPLQASVASANLINSYCDYLLNTGYYTGCYQGVFLAL